MSSSNSNMDDRAIQEDADPAHPQTSRGEFLKWSGVALSGLYVGPKITSFAISKTRQTGSPAPSNHYTSSYSSTTTYTSSGAAVLPATGGAAGRHPAPIKSSREVDHQDWIPAAGAGAAALGWYIRKQANAHDEVEVEAHDADQTD